MYIGTWKECGELGNTNTEGSIKDITDSNSERPQLQLPLLIPSQLHHHNKIKMTRTMHDDNYPRLNSLKRYTRTKSNIGPTYDRLKRSSGAINIYSKAFSRKLSKLQTNHPTINDKEYKAYFYEEKNRKSDNQVHDSINDSQRDKAKNLEGHRLHAHNGNIGSLTSPLSASSALFQFPLKSRIDFKYDDVVDEEKEDGSVEWKYAIETCTSTPAMSSRGEDGEKGERNDNGNTWTKRRENAYGMENEATQKASSNHYSDGNGAKTLAEEEEKEANEIAFVQSRQNKEKLAKTIEMQTESKINPFPLPSSQSNSSDTHNIYNSIQNNEKDIPPSSFSFLFPLTSSLPKEIDGKVRDGASPPIPQVATSSLFFNNMSQDNTYADRGDDNSPATFRSLTSNSQVHFDGEVAKRNSPFKQNIYNSRQAMTLLRMAGEKEKSMDRLVERIGINDKLKIWNRSKLINMENQTYKDKLNSTKTTLGTSYAKKDKKKQKEEMEKKTQALKTNMLQEVAKMRSAYLCKESSRKSKRDKHMDMDMKIANSQSPSSPKIINQNHLNDDNLDFEWDEEDQFKNQNDHDQSQRNIKSSISVNDIENEEHYVDSFNNFDNVENYMDFPYEREADDHVGEFDMRGTLSRDSYRPRVPSPPPTARFATRIQTSQETIRESRRHGHENGYGYGSKNGNESGNRAKEENIHCDERLEGINKNNISFIDDFGFEFNQIIKTLDNTEAEPPQTCCNSLKQPKDEENIDTLLDWANRLC